MIETQPMGCTCPAIVRCNVEPLIPEMTHDLELILRHRPKAVVRVSRATFGLARIAIATKVGEDDSESLGQMAGDLVPDHMGLRITVEEQ